MAKKLALGGKARKEIAEGLSRVLADSYVLYLKTHNYHWNVEGPRFRNLHLMFEEQYTELAAAVDEIAERIRALGQYAPGSFSQFSRLASIKGEDTVPSADEMVRNLARDHEAVEQTIRSVIPGAQDAGDEVTVGLLVERLAVHEKQVWMMKSMLAG